MDGPRRGQPQPPCSCGFRPPWGRLRPCSVRSASGSPGAPPRPGSPLPCGWLGDSACTVAIALLSAAASAAVGTRTRGWLSRSVHAVSRPRRPDTAHVAPQRVRHSCVGGPDLRRVDPWRRCAQGTPLLLASRNELGSVPAVGFGRSGCRADAGGHSGRPSGLQTAVPRPLRPFLRRGADQGSAVCSRDLGHLVSSKILVLKGPEPRPVCRQGRLAVHGVRGASGTVRMRGTLLGALRGDTG